MEVSAGDSKWRMMVVVHGWRRKDGRRATDFLIFFFFIRSLHRSIVTTRNEGLRGAKEGEGERTRLHFRTTRRDNRIITKTKKLVVV